MLTHAVTTEKLSISSRMSAAALNALKRQIKAAR